MIHLTPGLASEGWREVGDNSGWLVWSMRVPNSDEFAVYVDVDAYKRENTDAKAYPCEPKSPACDGFVVSIRVCDWCDGEPVDSLLCLWIEDESLALFAAKAFRQKTIEVMLRGGKPEEIVADWDESALLEGGAA